MHNYGYSGEYFDNLIPFERDLIVDMINNHINSIKKQEEIDIMGSVAQPDLFFG